ncbi:hypothetical protein H4Q26_002701 [Puccinia striiformis f. sp. tritici PST-130]|nr:hypothetical protein H4Q26_002701 [Puccinia striiformis f. sp. tritici PST-130]
MNSVSIVVLLASVLSGTVTGFILPGTYSSDSYTAAPTGPHVPHDPYPTHTAARQKIQSIALDPNSNQAKCPAPLTPCAIPIKNSAQHRQEPIVECLNLKEELNLLWKLCVWHCRMSVTSAAKLERARSSLALMDTLYTKGWTDTAVEWLMFVFKLKNGAKQRFAISNHHQLFEFHKSCPISQTSKSNRAINTRFSPVGTQVHKRIA